MIIHALQTVLNMNKKHMSDVQLGRIANKLVHNHMVGRAASVVSSCFPYSLKGNHDLKHTYSTCFPWLSNEN